MEIGGVSINNSVIGGTSGAIVQVVYSERTDYGTANAGIPFDDTIPQINEGFGILSGIITPRFATSRLLVETTVYAGEHTNTDNGFVCSLFRDSTSGAIAVDFFVPASSTTPAASIAFNAVRMCRLVPANSTATTTFQVRIGLLTTDLTDWNGAASQRWFGGALVSYIKVMEIS